jgi:hypothetical protein
LDVSLETSKDLISLGAPEDKTATFRKGETPKLFKEETKWGINPLHSCLKDSGISTPGAVMVSKDIFPR